MPSFPSEPLSVSSQPAPVIETKPAAAFQPINLFGDPMGGGPAPKNPSDDAFGELFNTNPVASTAVFSAPVI